MKSLILDTEKLGVMTDTHPEAIGSNKDEDCK